MTLKGQSFQDEFSQRHPQSERIKTFIVGSKVLERKTVYFALWKSSPKNGYWGNNLEKGRKKNRKRIMKLLYSGKLCQAWRYFYSDVGEGRHSKCLNHHNQRLCNFFLTGVNLVLQTYGVLSYFFCLIFTLFFV